MLKQPAVVTLIHDRIVIMSRNEKIIRSVEANFALEGMKFSRREKKNMADYLNGKISFDEFLGAAISRHKRKNIR